MELLTLAEAAIIFKLSQRTIMQLNFAIFFPVSLYLKYLTNHYISLWISQPLAAISTASFDRPYTAIES